jgi:hypothetical protein
MKRRSILERGGAPPLSVVAKSYTRSPRLARPRRLILCLFTSAFCLSALAQTNYTMDWHSVDGGGGTSTGGVYSASGTIGQPDAGGPMTGGDFSLTGGFWALYAVQTPGAPALRIFLTATNTAVVWWSPPTAGWNLQQNPDLTSTNWAAPSESITDTGTNRFIIVNPPAGRRFYRLHPL